MAERLSSFLQENLVSVLCFDDQKASLVAALVEPKLFDGEYAEIVRRSKLYLEKYRAPPKDHLADLFEEELTGDDKDDRRLYKALMIRIRESAPSINTEYVLSKLTAWVRQQELKQTIFECGRMLQDPDSKEPDELVSEVEVRLNKGLMHRTMAFDPGTRFGSTESLAFFDMQEETFSTGVPVLDKMGIGPARKELYLTIGIAKSGKTWHLAHIVKAALLRGLKVCHVTLEMSEAKISQRYWQSWFAVPKRPGIYHVTKVEQDDLKKIVGFDRVELPKKMTLTDPKARSWFKKKAEPWGRKFKNLIIKQFPDGSLSLTGLRAYLDMLEQTENFVPDLLIVDYADKMKLDPKNYRLDITNTFIGLRGIGVERNMAVVTASQANRSAATAELVGGEHVAEDWQKIGIADTVITYTQTKAEKQLGLARLNVSHGRNDADGIVVMIVQNYAYAQFCLKAYPMQYPESYMELVKQHAKGEDVEDSV